MKVNFIVDSLFYNTMEKAIAYKQRLEKRITKHQPIPV